MAEKIRRLSCGRRLRVMEVCGTHTQSFFRFGLRELLPADLELVSGPGCPVCVSAQSYIDQAIAYSRLEDTEVLTFGDMLSVPGTSSSLEKERAHSGNVLTVYSPLEALERAKNNPGKRVVFLAVGFETTAPAIAMTVLLAAREKLKNLYFFSGLKLIPPAIDYLLSDGRARLDAFLGPGHVSCVIGSRAYAFIPAKYGLNCCIAGFEPLDMLEALYLLLSRRDKKAAVINQYSRLVKPAGNRRAQDLIREAFRVSDVFWRGFGKVAASGLKLNKRFSRFDAELMLHVKPGHAVEKSSCRCPEVLRGLLKPTECPLFGRRCTPENAQGPCMVSSEGACNAYYRYGR